MSDDHVERHGSFRWRDYLVDGYRYSPTYVTDLGALFAGDCLSVLPQVRSESVDTVFADPPFNISKVYGSSTNDSMGDVEYVLWCKRWLAECVRVLKPGGALFVYNLPRWCIVIANHLMEVGLDFRHWIANDKATCMPIRGKLYPSHYGLVYFTKGRPNTFRRIKVPIQKCRHCGGDVRDYGGYRKIMGEGVNLKDVWSDIPPVRHIGFKSARRTANALSTKMLDRVVEMTTEPGGLVLDPFGGSGTTYAVCEAKGRRWLGVEVDSFCDVVDRLSSGTVRPHENTDVILTDQESQHADGEQVLGQGDHPHPEG